MHDDVERINLSRTHSGTSPPSRSEMNKSEFTGRIVAEVSMAIESFYSDLSNCPGDRCKPSSEETVAAVYCADSKLKAAGDQGWHFPSECRNRGYHRCGIRFD